MWWNYLRHSLQLNGIFILFVCFCWYVAIFTLWAVYLPLFIPQRHFILDFLWWLINKTVQLFNFYCSYLSTSSTRFDFDKYIFYNRTPAILSGVDRICVLAYFYTKFDCDKIKVLQIILFLHSYFTKRMIARDGYF